MPKRTQIQDYEQIERADELEGIVQDKRATKRANKKKAKRRNRHYGKTLLRHLTKDLDD